MVNGASWAESFGDRLEVGTQELRISPAFLSSLFFSLAGLRRRFARRSARSMRVARMRHERLNAELPGVCSDFRLATGGPVISPAVIRPAAVCV